MKIVWKSEGVIGKLLSVYCPIIGRVGYDACWLMGKILFYFFLGVPLPTSLPSFPLPNLPPLSNISIAGMPPVSLPPITAMAGVSPG